MDQPTQKTKPGLRDYWQTFLRRKWLIILPIISIAFIAIPGSFLLTPEYQATTTLIAQEMERGSILNSVGNIPVPANERLETIRIKIESRSYMMDVANRVDVAGYLNSIGKPSDPESIFKYLRKIVSFRVRGDRLIMITVMHPIPAMAKDIANAVADNYVNKTLLSRQSATSQTTDFIKQQMELYWQRLTQAEENLAKAQEKSPLGYLSEDSSRLVTEAAKFKTDLFEVELDIDEAKRELEKVKEIAAGRAREEFSASGFYLDPEVAKFQTKLASLQVQYDQISTKYTDQHPEIRKLKGEIAQAQIELDQAKARFSSQQQDIPARLQYWQYRVANLEAKKTALNDKISEYDRKMQLLPERQIELARLQREKSVADGTYSMLLGRQNTLELMQSSEAQNMGRTAEVLDVAVLPDFPMKPNKKKIAVLALAMGMFIGGGSAFLLEYFDRSFRTVDEVADYLGIPVLSAIPKLKTPDSEIKRRKYRIIKIAGIVLACLLVLIVAVDIISTQFLFRGSIFLKIARAMLGFLRRI